MFRPLSIRVFKKALKVYEFLGLQRIKFFKQIIAVWVRNLKSQVAYIDGNKMFLDPDDSLQLSIFGEWEPLETELVKRIVRKGDTVLDIGANIGYYTLILAKLVGENGSVYAFEPDPSNFEILKKNVEVNGFNNVVLVQAAVSDRGGKTNLYISEHRKGGHRIYDLNDHRRFIEVNTIKLDEYFKSENKSIDFIKMDIEGAEGLALAGMGNLLEKNKVKIIMEYAPSLIKKCGAEPKGCLDILLRQNYSFDLIDERKAKIIPVVSSKLATLGDDTNINIFCKKNDSLLT